MNLLSLDGISKSVGDGPLFSKVSTGICDGERIGFVGPNGCGKSTLLKLIAGRLVPDEGSIARKRDLVVTFLDQNPSWESGDTIRDFLFRSDDPLVALVGRYEAALESMARAPAEGGLANEAGPRSAGPKSGGGDRAEKELARLTHEMEEKGGFGLEHRFSSFLSELGIQDLDLKMDSLSGGMVKKAALTRALAPDSELVLLDEPTNHLDLDTIEWLERKLVESSRAFVLVTHDRWFLDAVCTWIMEIDGGKVSKYEGGYSDYLARVAAREEESVGRERKRESILRVELEWLKRGPKARGGKDKKRKSRIKEMIDGRPGEAAAGSDAFQTGSRRLGTKVLELHGVSKSWDGRAVLSPFSYKLTRGECIGVMGPNGSGKSTLLDLIARRYESDSGSIDYGETVSIGYFDQHAFGIDLSVTVLDYVCSAAERIRMNDGFELTAEQFLERFGFPRAMFAQPLEKLSGGELRRLLLVRLLIQSPNVLLLDEPTNDFDIPTIALLEDFLHNFGGCVIAVSHDRAFLEGLADSLWVLDGKGGVSSYVGSYADWREARAGEEELQRKLEAEKSAREREQAAARSVASVAQEKSAKLSFREKKEFEGLLPEIDALEAEKSEIESSFADPEFARNAVAYQRAQSRYAQIDALIAARTARWEELAERQ